MPNQPASISSSRSTSQQTWNIGYANAWRTGRSRSCITVPTSSRAAMPSRAKGAFIGEGGVLPKLRATRNADFSPSSWNP